MSALQVLNDNVLLSEQRTKINSNFGGIESNGILPWDATVTFVKYALTVGSDGKLYQATAANLNKDPMSATGDWAEVVGGVSGYTITQAPLGVLRTFDADNYTNNEMARVLATLIDDLS